MIVVFDRGSARAGSPRFSVDTIFPCFGVFGFTTMGGGAGWGGALDSGMLWGARAGTDWLGRPAATVGWVALSSR